MEQLIRELNLPANQGAPERINEIQKQIQQLQRDKSAWQLGLDFLQQDDSIIRFYGALTLTIKINADWDLDNVGSDDGMGEYLLEALIANYVRLVLAGDAGFVLQKICSTLTALKQRLGSYWHHPVRHVLTSLVNQQFEQQSVSLEENQTTSITHHVTPAQLSGAVRFATTLVEDLTTKAAASNEQHVGQISENCLDALQLLSHCLSLSWHRVLNPVVELDSQPVDLARSCLQALPLWIGQLKAHGSHGQKSDVQSASIAAMQCIAAALNLIDTEPFTGPALQCLISIQQSSPRLMIKADPQFPLSFTRSQTFRTLLVSLQEGDFSAEGVLFVEFLEAIMAEVDLSSPDYMIEGQYSDLLQALLTLLKCAGIAMVEDITCQAVLEIVVLIMEGYTDWDDDKGALDFLKAFVREACESCLLKIKMPSEEMVDATQSWDADDRTRFNDFRLDVQDFLQSAFAILGSSLVEAIVYTLNKDASETSWPDFEASLFSLTALSDTITAELDLYDPLIQMTLASDSFKMVIHSQTVPDKARNTSIRFLTELTAYLQQSPDLMHILNFLFSSLHQPSLVSSASRAIYTLCDTERVSLVSSLPAFICSLGTIPDLRDIERHRIYGGVAAVLQALPEEQAKVQPLAKILEIVSQNALQAAANDSETETSHFTDALQTLAAIGRGLRTPNDALLDNESNASTDPNFWTTGPGSSVQQQVLAMYNRMHNTGRGSADSEFTEASCDFLRSGFTEEHPSPFKFSSAMSTELVSETISLRSPNIDAVMGCASSLVASMHLKDFRPYLAQLLQKVRACTEQLLTGYKQTTNLGDSNFPSASLDFVTRLLRKWAEKLLCAEDGRNFLELFVQLALLVISDPDTLPRRSAASFFSALVEIKKPGKALEEASEHNLNKLMQDQSPSILAVVLRLVGGECARSELEVLADPLRRYVVNLPMLFKNISREAMKEESGVLTRQALEATTSEQRLRFVAQLDALRGGRRSNEMVKDFWVACRGSSFGYIA